MSEGLRSSSDLGGKIEERKMEFPDYDFSQVDKLGPFWYISNESEENQAKYNKILQQNK